MREGIKLLDDTERAASPTARDLLAVFFRQKRIAMVAFGVGCLAVMAYTLAAPSYRSEMKVLLRRGRVDPVVAPTPSQAEFTRVAGIELAGQFTGLIASVTLARMRVGVWAPVAGQTAWQILVLISTFYASSVKWNCRLRVNEARRMLRYGIGLTVSLRAWQARTLVNPMLVARFAGAEAVAYVALAVRIAESLGALRLAAGRIAIAVLARLQHKTEQFRSALEQALHVQVLTLGPLLCGFALSGSFVMKHIIGVRWMPSLAVYPFIAAGVLVNSVYNLQASGLFVMGKQWIVTSAFAVHVALLAGVTWLLVPRLGIAGYGWAELGACAGYWIIHSGTEKSMSPSYRRLAPLTAGFIAILFLVPTAYGAFR